VLSFINDAHDGPIYSLALTDDGKIVSCSFSKIKIYDLNSQKCDTIYNEKNEGVYKLICLPQNKLVSSSFKYINFWDLNKNQYLYSIEAHNNYITCLLIYNEM
jgi:WD40 repeat protein